MDISTPGPTKYLPAERATPDTITRQHKMISSEAVTVKMLDTIPHGLLVLNSQRQIIYANRKFNQLLPQIPIKTILGNRPGEAINCVHAIDEYGGCGTTEFCSTCGAAKAILTALRGEADVQECRIIRINADTNQEALDIRVYSSPFPHKEETFTVFAVEDISHEKRRKVLERIFFHDIMNTAQLIQGITDLVEQDVSHQTDLNTQMIQILGQAAIRLIDEIEAQRQLTAAESGELVANHQQVSSLEILKEVIAPYLHQANNQGLTLKVDPPSQSCMMYIDPALLRRVLGNMVKNAIEASVQGDTITVGCRLAGKEMQFWVHNPAFIPRPIQLQLFHRSFSTKGLDRGVGTYSMKLLSEQYLNGRVSFVSTIENGTHFFGQYPISPDNVDQAD